MMPIFCFAFLIALIPYHSGMLGVTLFFGACYLYHKLTEKPQDNDADTY